MQMLFSATFRQPDAQGQDFRSVVSCIHLLPQSVQQNQIEFVIFRFMLALHCHVGMFSIYFMSVHWCMPT